MTTLYVTFDLRSGRIVGAHHGAIDEADARATGRLHRGQDLKSIDEHLAVLKVPSAALHESALYKVDIESKQLVAATAQDGGVGLGVGQTGRE